MTNKNDSLHYGCKISNNLEHWRPIIEKWFFFIDKYCDFNNGDDAPYYYTERANVGVLSAAAWAAGSIALEEYQHYKAKKSGGDSYGRVDLFVGFSCGKQELIEAKYKWVFNPSNKKIKDSIAITMNNAKQDAINTTHNHQNLTVLNVAFFTPVFSTKIDQKRIDTIISDCRELDYGLVAWCFPKQNYDDDNKEYWPGVILAINSR